MPDHTSNGMQCHEFDGLLTDALDGVLTGAKLDTFHAHARSCSACGPLFAEVQAGRNWLKDLTEVEPPVSLVTNILASTTGVDTQRLRVNVSAPQPRIGWIERAQARVVRYYDNIKLVYQVQAAVRELKRNVTPAASRPGESAPAKKDHKNDTTQQPEQKQDRNYSQNENHLILACAPLGPSVFDLPVVSVTTYRRF